MNMPEPTESNLKQVHAPETVADRVEHLLFVVFMLGMVFGGMYAAAAMIWSAMR